MGHLVLGPHHYNIKLLVCLAWNDKQSSEIAPVLFVLLKNFCPPAIEVFHDERVTFYWRSFHSTGYRGLFVFSHEGLPWAWPPFSFLATLNGNQFVFFFNVEIASGAINVSMSPKEVKETGSKSL